METELSGFVVFLAVISTTFIWTIVYFTSWMVWPHKRALWHCIMVVTIHGVVITVLTYMYQMRIDSWPYSHPGEISTAGQTLTLVVCLGFFLFETGWYIAHPGSKTWTLWIHHIGALLFLAAPLYYGHSGAECCASVFVTENTIPVLLLRWFVRDAGCRPLYVIILDYLFLTTYFYWRAIVGTSLTFELALHPDAYVPVKIFTFWVYAVGLVYFKTTAASSIRYTMKALNGTLKVQNAKTHSQSNMDDFDANTGCRVLSQT